MQSANHEHDAKDLLGVLEGVKPKPGGGWKALRPAHDDHDPSLDIDIGEGSVLYLCRAGCDQAEVTTRLRELGYPKRNGTTVQATPIPRKSPTKKSKPDEQPRLNQVFKNIDALCHPLGTKTSRAWAYRGDGKVAGYSIRIDKPDGKEFRMAKVVPGADSLMLGGMDKPWPLYVRPGTGMAYAQEGEKVSDILHAQLVAAGVQDACCVTSIGGGGSARHSDWTPFHGRDVVILPDNDKSGKAYASEVTAILSSIAASIRIVRLPNLPPKGDIEQFVDGKTPFEVAQVLKTLTDAAEPVKIPPQPHPTCANVGTTDPNTARAADDDEPDDADEPDEPDEVDFAEGKEPKRSQADLLVELVIASGADLFHDRGGHDAESFATLSINSHRETMPIKSRAFRRWLGKLLYDAVGKAISTQGLKDGTNVIEAKALFEGNEREVHVRMANHDGAIWLDLADAEWRAVEITSTGWRVVESDDVPVRFVRKRGMLPLPTPVSGGSIDELRAIVNLPNDDDWALFVGWLVMALNPVGPYPILVLSGEQGSAKSTAARMARRLIDPNAAPLRRPPRDDRDLLIAATNGWIVAFDNLSGLSPALSDVMSAVATGTGFGTRELHTDDAEKLFNAMRPIVVNGIDDLASRGDFLDRAISLTLPVIPPENRREERALWPRFDEVCPRVLGALLDAVGVAIRNLPGVQLKSLPRMADFARWIVATEPALGWKPGTFMSAYHGNREGANTLAIEASSVGPVILALMNDRDTWEGKAGELLRELESRTDEKTLKSRDWPKNARAMGAALRRIAPNLRAENVDVKPGEKHGGRRRTLIRIEKVWNDVTKGTQVTRTG